MKSFKYILIALVCLAAITSKAQTKQDKNAAKAAAVRSLVESRNFTFVAQYANPQRGGHRYLNSDYDMTVRKDSVITYLPYFGRAYFDVPYNPTEGGIKFTSTNFGYKATAKKKGGWDVLITPKDVKYYQKIILNISSNGNCYAQFIITNKDEISFDGYLADKKSK